MKYLGWMLVLLALGWLSGCAAAANEQNAARREPLPALTEPAASPTRLPSPTILPTSTPSPTGTPTPTLPSPTPLKPTETTTPSPITPTPTTDLSTSTAITASLTVANTVKDGPTLYREQYCGNCHRLSTLGTPGIVGPPHDGMAVTAEARIHAADYTGTATTPAEYIRESIVDPGIYLVAGYDSPRQRMPAFTHLSEAEVDALVQFLLQQR